MKMRLADPFCLVTWGIVTTLLSMPSLALANCDLTDEYKNLRLVTYKALQAPLNQCKTSVDQWGYWKAFAKCERMKAGKHVGGGCAHIAGLTASTNIKDYKHCESLRPTERDFQEALAQEALSKGIPECEPSSEPHE